MSTFQQQVLDHLTAAEMFINSATGVVNDLEQRFYDVNGAIQGAKTEIYAVDDSGEGVLGEALVTAQSSIDATVEILRRIGEIKGQYRIMKDRIQTKRDSIYSAGQ